MQRGARGEGATAEPAAAEAAAAAMVWCGGARRDARAAGVGWRAARTATAARGRARHLREQQLRQPACRRTTPRARRRCPPTRANSPAAPTAPWLLTHGAVSTMATAAGAHELPAARRRVRVVARHVLPVRAVQQVLGEIGGAACARRDRRQPQPGRLLRAHAAAADGRLQRRRARGGDSPRGGDRHARPTTDTGGRSSAPC